MFSSKLTSSTTWPSFMNNENNENYDSSNSENRNSMIYIDETTNDGFNNNNMMIMETDGDSSFSSTDNDNSVLYDSGISSDSCISSCSESIYVQTGAINFLEICAKKSPEIPAEYSDDLDDLEQTANISLSSSSDFDSSFRAEPCGRRSPFKDISNSSNSQSSLFSESPVSRKSSRAEIKCSRKRIRASTIKEYLAENPALPKRNRPQFHRAFSTSDIEIQSNYDSSPEATSTKYSLKTVTRIRSNDIAFRRIDSACLSELIEKEEFSEQYILIDCRYPFEFNGGHIKGAINLYNPELLHSTFYPSSTDVDSHNIHTKKPIFYCEFSSVRGPNMANALRELDRQLNRDRYPQIDYNEIYVLSEGYRHFFHNANVKSYCEPPSYIPMKCKKHHTELQKFSYHQKSGPSGFSIRSRSTYSLVQAQRANLSPCFCGSICTCIHASYQQRQQQHPHRVPSVLGEVFSQISLRSPSQLSCILSPPPFCLDSLSPCNPPS